MSLGLSFFMRDAFELWCWRRLLRVPWTARRSNQLILKEINPKYSLEGLMLKLKLQYFGHLMRRINSLEKTLMLGKIEGRRRRGDRGWDGWMASPTQWAWVCPSLRDGDRQGSLACYSSWGHKVLDAERLNNDKISWATLLVLRDCLLGVFVETEGAAPGGVSLHALPWQVLPSTSFPQCTPALISLEQGSIV